MTIEHELIRAVDEENSILRSEADEQYNANHRKHVERLSGREDCQQRGRQVPVALPGSR